MKFTEFVINRILNVSVIVLLIILFLSVCLQAGENSPPVSDSTTKIDTIAAETDEDFGEFEEFDVNGGDDDFGEFEEFGTMQSCSGKTCYTNQCNKAAIMDRVLNWALGILAVTLLSGLMVRSKAARNLRGLFLVASVAILGFYKGACPCPISSFSNLVLAGIGVDVDWQHLVWFLGLIPITYLVGKVWCGWVCHLGALQELIFLPGRLKFFKSIKAQKIMKTLRWLLLATLIIQLIITKTYLYSKIDPFRVAFNLISINTAGWILLGLLLLTSLFIYRPFCRAACPIGLILGWICKIPGASIIGLKGECNNCKVCSNTCKIDAIHRYDKHSVLDNKECITCGECFDACVKDGLILVRKSKDYGDKVVYKSNDVD